MAGKLRKGAVRPVRRNELGEDHGQVKDEKEYDACEAQGPAFQVNQETLHDELSFP
jgi:hypothetical protein